MHLQTYKLTAYRKRIAEPVRYDYNIIYYDSDNLYPQRVKEIRRTSPLVTSATKIYRNFIFGEGFESLQDEQVNQDGDTWNDILKLVSKDYSEFQGFGLLLNADGNGAITEVQHIPFEFIRYGLPDRVGRIKQVAISRNWEQDSSKEGKNYAGVRPTYYPLYNPKTAGEDAILGRPQVLYYTPEKFCYPYCTFDAVLDAAQADGEIQVFELSNIQNGFHSGMLFKYPGKFESEEEKLQVQAQFPFLTFLRPKLE
jgi:hypothetical protein